MEFIRNETKQNILLNGKLFKYTGAGIDCKTMDRPWKAILSGAMKILFQDYYSKIFNWHL